jgi:fructokinase
MRKRILSMGEAVVDILPAGGGMWRPVAGGSSYNVALALGRLSAGAAFVGRLSLDEQGERMTRALSEAGVDTDLLCRDDRPSPLSLVEQGTQTGSARYAIHLAGTAHAPPTMPPGWREGAAHLHVSSFSAVTGDWGRAVAEALDAANGFMTRSFDVNIRAALLPGREIARELVADRIERVDLVKASDEDLSWLFPGRTPAETAADWSAQGRATILTRGAGGATLFFRGETLDCGAFDVPVSDTVGAGDVFVAAFLSRAHEAGLLARIAQAAPDEIGALLRFANAAAALCCMRADADAPSSAEVTAFMAASPLR